MLIQPYVENAIKHGILYEKERRCRLDVYFKRTDDELICRIADNGVGRERAKEIQSSFIQMYKSRGTQIVEDRIKIMQELGHGISVQTYNNPEGGTIVVLNPSNRVATTILDIGVFCGLHSGMFICEPAGEDGEHFTADVREVSQFIDVTLKHTNENRQQLIDFVEHVISLAPCTPPAMTI